ncbi:MAG: 4'-phosphopantetheinyl transferase superfamily protein [Halioglobus sp.]|nr:4'-phosphopantetheinyl transferase superfamily protein [Halioglobus sp.]
MDDSQRARNHRFSDQTLRDSDVITRALQRTVLSEYEDISPSEWRFSQDSSGKPYIANSSTSLSFNLSHTREWVACAVARHSLVGIDIEDSGRNPKIVPLANRFFSRKEYQDLLRLPAMQQKNRFFDYWTLKEAYIKARGEGISLGLNRFGFKFSSNGAIGFWCDSELQDDPDLWQFWLSSGQSDHRMALAVKAEALGCGIDVRHFFTIPQHSAEVYEGPLLFSDHH